MANPRAAVMKFVDGFNRHDVSIMELFTRDVAWQDPGSLEPEGGWDRLRSGFVSAWNVFPDIKMEVSHYMADGDWVSFEGLFTGTFVGGNWFVGGKERPFPRTNRPVKATMAWFFKVDNEGKISYWSWYQDLAQLLAQTGLRPDQLG